jgi:hypothetical protein
MDYFWLTYNDNEDEIERYQELAYSDEWLSRYPNGGPDYEQWISPQGKIVTLLCGTPVMEIARGTKKKKETDFYYGNHIIVSEKIKKILDGYIKPEVCQFVRMILNKKNTNENIYLLNPLVAVDCVNKEKTIYKRRGLFDYIITPVLRVKNIPDIPIFLILERPGIIIINQEIHQLLSADDIRGFFAKKVECGDGEQNEGGRG